MHRLENEAQGSLSIKHLIQINSMSQLLMAPGSVGVVVGGGCLSDSWRSMYDSSCPLYDEMSNVQSQRCHSDKVLRNETFKPLWLFQKS